VQLILLHAIICRQLSHIFTIHIKVTLRQRYTKYCSKHRVFGTPQCLLVNVQYSYIALQQHHYVYISSSNNLQHLNKLNF